MYALGKAYDVSMRVAMRSSYYGVARDNDLAHSLLAVVRGFSSVAVT